MCGHASVRNSDVVWFIYLSPETRILNAKHPETDKLTPQSASATGES
jgi:hypothetical protein